MSDDRSLAALVLIVVGGLIIYLFTRRDSGEYVKVADREANRWEPKRQSINYYAFRGPFFVEDFTNFNAENNPKQDIAPTSDCPPNECDIPKYNKHTMGVLDCHQDVSKCCTVDTLTAEQSWRNEYHNSPYRLGGPDGYSQAVNNNLSAPNNLKAAQMKSVMGDWFDPKDKISPWCYAESMKPCLL
jgi:hypothetical protein